jgi:hypothetical protein
MKPLLDQQRSAVRNLLIQKFDDLEQSPDVDPELEDVPEVEQTSFQRQPSAMTSARPPTDQKRPPTGDVRPATGGVRPTAGRPPLAKSKEVKALPVPKTASQSDAANIKEVKVPITPKAPNGPSPREKRLSPSENKFTPGSPRQCPPQPKWKSDFSVQEEDIMDQILEETGLVFGKSEKLIAGLEEEIQDLGISCC